MLLEDDLTLSAVVANSAMNRERQLAGVTSYARELGFNPLDRVRALVLQGRHGSRLGLCCGGGRALVQAAHALGRDGLADRVALVGVDLVDYFDPVVEANLPVELVCASVTNWAPARRFDLINCVHGLHYVGDKLAAVTRAASWLTDDGLLVAGLDLTSIRCPTADRPEVPWPQRCVGPASGTTRAGAESAVRAGATAACPTTTSAPTTRPARTTQTSRR